jgi:hypothetical protein
VNTGYVIWFAVLVAVAGATLLWLAVGVVPEIPPDPGQLTEPGVTEGAAPASVRGIARAVPATSEPAPGPELPPGPASEAAGEDGIARPS